jgi:hypothetical protein
VSFGTSGVVRVAVGPPIFFQKKVLRCCFRKSELINLHSYLSVSLIPIEDMRFDRLVELAALLFMPPDTDLVSSSSRNLATGDGRAAICSSWYSLADPPF